ncbi:hypothetical protein [Consotaella salsifontis]|uniref:Uncharacterized protein n=1 Tax=Consotaella salsifontis TaxID=1365950 RepID=A0A1T4TA04_9HYPH|nr:hypothetical protein [Consotaella salsifontis]SKA37345.1 hypothetical protein SAMN05428963_12217 [Consotaella salsifontis]
MDGRIAALTMTLAAALVSSPSPGEAASSDPAPQADGPTDRFCFLSDDSTSETCVSLWFDEDGYEVCLSDDSSDVQKCASEYRDPPEQQSEPDLDFQNSDMLLKISRDGAE